MRYAPTAVERIGKHIRRLLSENREYRPTNGNGLPHPNPLDLLAMVIPWPKPDGGDLRYRLTATW